MSVKLNEANETLSNLEKKAIYDEHYREWKSLETSASSTVKSNKQAPDRTLEGRLAQEGLEIIDKRPQGGTLWVVGSAELASFFKELQTHGFNFVFMNRGGRAVKRRPSWYLKN